MEDSVSQLLAEELPPPLRLAVSYAPRRAQAAWTALLALDRRLSRAALGASEPLLGQIRLAWWRDRFREPASQWPGGEPLLAALEGFDPERPALEALVDGWEQMIGQPDEAALANLVEARAHAVVALAHILGCRDRDDEVSAAARAWSRRDLASGPNGSRSAAGRAAAIRLPRSMRPLVILTALAEQGDSAHGLRGFLRIVRLGLLGC